MNLYVDCYAMQSIYAMQAFLDNAWYPNVNKELKTVLQAAQNKCKRVCLKLNDRSII